MGLLSPEKVRIFLVNYLSKRDPKRERDGGQINDDAYDFLKEGIIDSMGVLEMIAAIEEEFGITVDFEQMEPEEFTILGPFCRYVAENAVAAGG